MRDAVLLVFANKQDLPNAHGAPEEGAEIAAEDVEAAVPGSASAAEGGEQVVAQRRREGGAGPSTRGLSTWAPGKPNHTARFLDPGLCPLVVPVTLFPAMWPSRATWRIFVQRVSEW